MLKFWIPIGSEKLFEYVDKSFCQYLFRFVFLYIQRIKTKGELLVSWIKYYNIILTRFWYVHHDLFYSISVGIYYSNSSTLLDVVYHQMLHKFGFSCTSFSNYIHMLKSIFIMHSNWDRNRSIIRNSYYIYVLRK